jgi:hypothetical protein
VPRPKLTRLEFKVMETWGRDSADATKKSEKNQQIGDKQDDSPR